MKYLIITKIPVRQGLLGPIRARNVLDEAEAESLEELKDGLHVPLDGECLVIEEQHVTVVKSRVMNEVETR